MDEIMQGRLKSEEKDQEEEKKEVAKAYLERNACSLEQQRATEVSKQHYIPHKDFYTTGERSKDDVNIMDSFTERTKHEKVEWVASVREKDIVRDLGTLHQGANKDSKALLEEEDTLKVENDNQGKECHDIVMNKTL